MLFSCTVHAQGLVAQEYEVKSAFIYNFLKFIDLNNKSTEINFCISSNSDIPTPFKLLEDKIVDQRKIKVTYVTNRNELKPCSLVYFLSSSELGQTATVLKQLSALKILTIGESVNFGILGGMINFYLDAERIRFEIYIEAARSAEISISSKLLQLAKVRELSREEVQ